MRTTLENFIREHRNELDVFTPSEAVWSGIESGMRHPTFVKSNISWLKYAGFSASVIAVLVYLNINTFDASTEQAQQTELKAQTDEVVSASAPITYGTGEKTIAPQASTIQFSYASKNAAQAPILVSVDPAKKQISPVLAAPIISHTSATTSTPSLSPPPVQNESESGMWSASKDTLKIDTIFSGVKTIEVESSSFDVNITTIIGDKISFKANCISQTKGLVIGKRSRTIRYEKKDDVLIITEEKQGRSWMVGYQTDESAVLNFEVPVSTNVVLRSSYGDVKVSGLQNKSSNITASYGDVKLDNLISGLMLAIGFGDLSATDITGNVAGKVSFGDVSFTNLKGNVDIETSHGDQSYKNVTGNIKAQCRSGDFKINSMKGHLDIDSKYGDISLEDFKGSAMLNTSSGDIKGKNVELTEKMEANTHYGDVKMKFTNALSSLSFDVETKYGSINLEKDGEKITEDNHLILRKGNILVKAHTASGDQSYK